MAWGWALFSYERADCRRFVSSGNIEFESLSKIESNLTECKKVSLIFLLYDDVNVAIERLEMLVGDYEKDSRCMNLLEDWAEGGEQQYWKETLLEGLAIIKAYKEIRDLNFYPQQVKDHFLPDQLNKSIFIHPVKKALFSMCEEFLIKDTENFIRGVLDSSKIAIQNRFNYMELFLLHMMKNEIITVGTWSPLEKTRTQAQEKSNLDIISNFLKINNFFQLYDMLNSVEYFVNNTSDSKIDASNCTASINVTSELNEKDDIANYPIYDITSMGWFLIFNHKTFVKTKPELTNRQGTEKDVIELEKCWRSYGFITKVFNNLKAKDVLKKIKMYAESVEENHSAFGVCILSHGESSGVFGSDGKLVLKNEIKDSLHAENLIGKPKILLIQACRGENTMHASKKCEEKTCDKDNSDEELQSERPDIYPEKPDLVEFWSTVDNYLAYRHPIYGSVFIQILCKCLMKYGNTNHLVDIFRKVHNTIGEKNIQISECISTLRKHFYLKRS